MLLLTQLLGIHHKQNPCNSTPLKAGTLSALSDRTEIHPNRKEVSHLIDNQSYVKNIKVLQQLKHGDLSSSVIITFSLTIHHNCRRHAPSLGNNVGSHAGVVPRVGETCLSDDEVVVCSRVNVLIQVGIYGLLVL